MARSPGASWGRLDPSEDLVFRALVGVVDDDTGTCDVFRLPSSARALAPGGQSLWSVCGEGKCAGPVNT